MALIEGEARPLCRFGEALELYCMIQCGSGRALSGDWKQEMAAAIGKYRGAGESARAVMGLDAER
jgi:hypothetical protein